MTNPILISNTSTTISVLGVSGTSNVGFSLGTVNSLIVTTPSGGNATSLAITQSDTTNNPTAELITNNGTGMGLDIIQNGILASNKFALYVNSNAVNTNSPLVWLRSTNASTTGATLKVDNAGTGPGLDVKTGGVLIEAGSLTLTTGNKLSIGTGTNASIGTAVLVAGTVTVSTTAVTANSIIMLTCQLVGGTVGVLSKGTVVAGTSFVINSSIATDTSTIGWIIIN